MSFYSSYIFRAVPVGGVISLPFDFLQTDEIGDVLLVCDGSEMLKTDYSILLAEIGTTYGETDGSGGVGTTHFRLPDYRGVFLAHTDGTYTIGDYRADTMVAHTHDLKATSNDDWNNNLVSSSIRKYQSNTILTANTTSSMVGAAETRPMNAYANYCIRYI